MRHAMSIERSGHTSLDRREAPHMDAGPHGRSSRNYAFLVSQKISEISSILPSS